MNTTTLIRLQCAADKIGTLADMVDELGRFLDATHDEIGEELYSRVRQAFPHEHWFGPKANAGLVKLMHQLTPPE